jgi:hypothetical protein
MRKAGVIALGSVEYVLTLVFTSCFMMAIWRWVLDPDRDTKMMLPVFCGGLALTVIFLSDYYFFRLIRCRSLPFRIVGSVLLAGLTTALTIPGGFLISDLLELPSQHVMGW